MLKRIRYVSEFTMPLSRTQIRELAKRAAEKNATLDITGVLMVSGTLFFQIIEGPPEPIDQLFQTILRDTRHKNVMLLREEYPVDERFFPDWGMRPVEFSDEEAERLEPLQVMLETIFAQYRTINSLSTALEKGIWREFIAKL